MVHMLFGHMDLCLVALVGSIWLNAVLVVLVYLSRKP
jgi:hypothetical protein